MRELFISRLEREPRQPSAATPALESPLPYRVFPLEYTSAVSGVPLRQEGVRWPLVAETFVHAALTGAEVLPSWPFFATWGATVWGEPKSAGPTSVALGGAVSTDELVRIEEPSRIGFVRPEDRWLNLVTKVFPHVRPMTAGEAAAYRVFKRKISRQIGRIDLP